MISCKVTVNLDGLKRFAAVIAEDLRSKGNGPVRDAIRQWAARYRAWAQERFDKYSKGGGDWSPLADSTVKGRRKGPRWNTKGQFVKKGSAEAAAMKVAILRDTGTLFSALAPVFGGKPGQLQEDLPFGVRVGIGGPGGYKGGTATIADIAQFHQVGSGHLPVRKIIVEPDQDVVARMVDDMQRAVDKLGGQASGGGK